MRPIMRRTLPVLGLAFLAGVAFALGSALTTKVVSPWSSAPPNFLSQPLVRSNGMSEDTVSEVVKKASPAVVKITSVIRTPGQSNPNIWNPFSFPLPSQSQEEIGVGSGFIISTSGYILTNQHVVNGAAKISVAVIGYATPFAATIVGQDYDLDLAVLKIHAPKPLPVLPLAPSTAPEVGTWVVAIGNPYGLSHTVTVGVISAEGRPITVPGENGGPQRTYSNLLQTDAAINPGNSGGPLLNLSGQVLGINTAVSTQGQGIGFAIPISTVHRVLSQLIQKGYVVHPWIGVSISSLDPSLAQYLGVPTTQGAVVRGVYPKGPAAQAGIRPGDVIVGFDGRTVASAQDLITLTEALKPGDVVTLRVDRGRSALTFRVTLAQKPSNL